MEVLRQLVWRIRDRLFRETGIFFSPDLIINSIVINGFTEAGAISYARRLANGNEPTGMVLNMIDVIVESAR